MLLALAGFVVAGAILIEGRPDLTWWAFWCRLPLWFRFVAGSLIGLAISVGLGSPVVRWFYAWAGRELLAETDDERWNEALAVHDWQVEKRVNRARTGKVERFIFTFITMAAPGLALAAMGGWLTLKMAAQWNKDIFPKDDDKYMHAKMLWNRYAFLGLLAGLVSMFCAGAGGVVARLIMGLPVIP
jgi:hypothetical protein